MYLGIDVGGTKTLVAALDEHGVIIEEVKFFTPAKYPVFLEELTANVDKLTTKDFKAVGVGIPGKVDRKNGIGVAFGNLSWQDVPIEHDIIKFTHTPTVIENDANLAGLSEAMLLKHYRKVLYLTISTGIGSGYIVDQEIDPELADSEAGHIHLWHKGTDQQWESFASGHAIFIQFGKKAQDITDATTWQTIARNLAVGFLDLIAVFEPNVIVVGGSVGTYYDRFGGYLTARLKRYDIPLLTIPPIQPAQRPERAVVYGCYDLARSKFGSPIRKT